jgi:ZIP family zinc transporter
MREMPAWHSTIMATPLRMGGMPKGLVFGAALLAGVPTGLGALLGFVLGGISAQFISLCLGFAGGAMLYITCSELIPESRDLHRGRLSSIGLVLGIIAGLLISSLL